LSLDNVAGRWARVLGIDRKQFDMFFDKMLNGFAYQQTILDESGKPIDYVFLEVNNAFENIMNLRKEQIIGRRATEIIPGLGIDPADWIRAYGQVALTGVSVQSESLVQPLGKWLKVSAYCPEKGFFVTLLEDITWRKRIEDILRVSETNEGNYRHLLEYAPTAIYEIDYRNQRFKSVNDAMCRLTGYSREELLAMNPSDLLDADSKIRFQERIRRGLAGEKIDEGVEYKSIVKDGRELWTVLNIKPTYKDGKLESALVVGYDITERKKTENALKQSEKKYRSLVDSSPDGVLVHIDGQVLYANAVAVKLYGADSFEQLASHNILKLIPTEDTNEAADRVTKLMDGQKIPMREARIVRMDGRIVPVEVVSSFVEHEGKRAIQAIVRDITERKRAQENLVRLASFPRLNPNPVVEVDIDGKVYYQNPAAILMFPELKQSTINHPFLGNWEDIVRAFRDEKKESLGREVTVGRSHFYQTLFPVPKTNRIRVYSMNVDALKQAENQLKETRDYLNNLLDHANAPIIVWNPEFKITKFNHAFERVTGLMEQDVVGKPLDILFPTERKEEAMAHIQSTLTGEYWESVEIPILHKDGTVKIALWNSANIHGVNGQIIATIAQGQDITERKRSEDERKTILDAVQREKERLSVLINSMSDEVWFADSDKKLVLVNPSATREFKLDSLNTKDVEKIAASFEVYRADGTPRPVEEAPPLRALKGETIKNEEEIIRSPSNGELIHRQVSASPVKDADGNIIGSVSVVRDITEIKKVEKELQALNVELEQRVQQRTAEVASERKRLFDVLESIPVMVCLLTPDHHAAFANRSFREKFGESHGRHCYDFCFGNKEPCNFCESYKVLETGRPHHWQVKGTDGSIIDAYDYPFTDVDGSPLILEMDLDITKQKQNEEELAKYREHLEQLVKEKTEELVETRDYLNNLLDYANAPIIVWNPELTITKFNHAFEKLTGLGVEEATGKQIDILFPMNRKEESMAYIRSTLTGRFWESVEIPILHKDGTVRTLLWNSANIYGASRQTIATIAQGQDITERKRVEEQLRETERFAAIGRTAAMVGHDLRNPLQAVVGNVALAEEQLEKMNCPPDEKREFKESLKELKSLTFYMDKIVSDLQDYARPVKPAPEKTDMRLLFENTLSACDIPTNVKRSIMIGKNFPKVRVDPAIIRRVMTNLITNAVQAMPQGGELRVRVSRRKNPQRVIITVEDTGVGIPIRNRSKLFTPLFTTKSKGQGFGLPVSKRLVEAYGGTLTYKSKVGKGTKFTIKLPILGKEKINLQHSN